jgi:hypothetical protein
MVKVLVPVFLSTFLLLCGGAAHERPEVSKQQKAIARLSAEVEAHAGGGEEYAAAMAALASGTTCGAGTMKAAMEAARKLANDGEREVILGALEKIKAGERMLQCVRRERCRLPAHPLAAAAAAPSLPAPRRHPLPISLTHTHTHVHTRPPAAPPARRRTPRSLGKNKIGDAGAAALAKALPASQLTALVYVHTPVPPPRRCPLHDATRSLSPSHTHARRAPRTPPHAMQFVAQQDRR